MNSQPDRERNDGVGIVIILLGTISCIAALTSGDTEEMVLGTISGLALTAIGGIALWLNRYNARDTPVTRKEHDACPTP
ncbi:MAG: hypothetical protein Q8R16_00735 [bacterium]|nr:hypothetical protein [bacterium]